LRWAYLVREIVAAGHNVEVISPNVPGYGPGGLPEIPAEVVIHRVSPGRLASVLLGRRRGGVASDCSEPSKEWKLNEGPSDLVILNWKGRLRNRLERLIGLGDLNWKGVLAEKLKRLISVFRFPDYRAEWTTAAVAKLDEILALRRPDVVVVSHEPACSLPIGLAAAKRGLPLVADLGDPVLAAYTSARWRRRAFRLEREICAAASLVSVTTQAAASLLIDRHHLSRDKFLVVTQGFSMDANVRSVSSPIDFDENRLELLYTGSFYNFRRAEQLLRSVTAHPDVRLTIATVNAPEYLREAAAENPRQIRIVGFIPHRVALSVQRSSDVLVNIANSDPVQIPGKIFEYFGAGRPIVHIRSAETDATSDLLDAARGGWSCDANEEVLRELFSKLLSLKRVGSLSGHAAPLERVLQYSWTELSRAWLEGVRRVLPLS